MKNKRLPFCVFTALAVTLSSCNFMSGSIAKSSSKSSEPIINPTTSSTSKDSSSLRTPSSSSNTFMVTWTDRDGTVLEEFTVSRGVTPDFHGVIMDKPTDDPLFYDIFSGWLPEVGGIYSNTTFVAQYERTEAFRFVDVNREAYQLQYCYLHHTKDIVVPATYSYGLPVIDISPVAFQFCEYMETLTISKNIEGTFDFSSRSYYGEGNKRLKEVIVDEENQYFKSVDGVLYTKDMSTILLCPAAKEGDFVVGDTVTTISDRAFMSSNLTSITIPNTVTSVGFGVFQNAEKLEKYTTGSISSIDSLYTVFGFEKTTARHGVNYWKINQLPIKEIVLTEGINRLPEHAFDGCVNVKTLSIPAFVDRVEEGSLAGCTSLERLYLAKSYENFRIAFKCEYYVPVYNDDGTLWQNVLTTSSEEPRTLATIEFGEGITELHGSILTYFEYLVTVILPSTLTVIGEKAFFNCIRLETVVIPNGVTTIGDGAFRECRSLKEMVIPDSVTTIGVGAFYDCGEDPILLPSNLESVSVGAGAFKEAKVFYPGDYTSFMNSGIADEFTFSFVYFYSESKPTDTGKYWHYVNNKPTIW